MFSRSYKSGCVVLLLALQFGMSARAAEQVTTKSGVVEGVLSVDGKVRSFKGVPFAAPPVGSLRWKPPQPSPSWEGLRKATAFGPRCMQGAIFSDMVFRDAGPNEDCLYLNVWTPVTSPAERLPVMVWIYGGGFQAGAASEPRQDGENLAKKGVVVVSMNYRLGLFGFFSHPELTKESPYHASGNYGLMDQTAALRWVHANIEAFGGDPEQVTIFGESAGSMSVSAQMASPLATGLFKRAIGESGAVFPLFAPVPTLAQKEQAGLKFAKTVGADTLQQLRGKPADELMKSALADKNLHFRENVDGYFFSRSPRAIYGSGEQAHVALLAGWNADEQSAAAFFGKDAMTKENYQAKIRADFKDDADAVLKLYPADSEEQMRQSARDLASDRFIAYSTWKWVDLQQKTGASPVYLYHFEQIPPVAPGEKSRGAYHSADIKYVFETLESEKLAWTSDDKKASDLISSYWVNFAKTSDPNGPGLPKWQRYQQGSQEQVMHLRVNGAGLPECKADGLTQRYKLLDQIAQKREATYSEVSSAANLRKIKDRSEAQPKLAGEK